jgi:hypothetical protein
MLQNTVHGLGVFIGDVEVVGWGLGAVGSWRGKRVKIDYGGGRRQGSSKGRVGCRRVVRRE